MDDLDTKPLLAYSSIMYTVHTYASSHRFAENSKWMTWSSSSDSERRYASIILPMVVDRSAVKQHSGTMSDDYDEVLADADQGTS